MQAIDKHKLWVCVPVCAILALFLGVSAAAGTGPQTTQGVTPAWVRTPQDQAEGEPPVWEYWLPPDVKGLDPWGEPGVETMDIVAIYEKEEEDALAFRLDLMDLVTEVLTPTFFALDFAPGGSYLVEPGSPHTFDVAWELMVSISGAQFSLYDPTFTPHPEYLSRMQIDRTLDFVSFAIDRQAFAAWAGDPFQMQALVAAGPALLDKTGPVPTDAAAGRSKLVVLSLGGAIGFNPDSISWYDGYRLRADERPGERRGFRFTLDAVETYRQPLTLLPFGLDVMPATEFLGINERLVDLESQGLLDIPVHPFYGHFMVWQADAVNRKMLQMAQDIYAAFGLPTSPIFYPYEGMLTPRNIQAIQEAGFPAIYAHDVYRYWFGWIEDWSDPAVVRADIEALRKVHRVNGMDILFHTAAGNYQGIYMDERWEPVDWDEWSEYDSYVGTDQGLYLWWRRTLQDMAMHPDQEQFFVIGTDYTLTAWMFPDVADYTFRWLASHPWIEVTTYSSILERGWAPIDHGVLPLGEDDLLYQHPKPDDMHYNAYFPQFYYGGIADGHSPLIPAGEVIEAYADYVPYLRDGQPIPSERSMGDAQTPGSIVYETLQNLYGAPENDLTTLAWMAYFYSIGEQTMHTIHFYAGDDPYYGGDLGGKYVSPDAKFVANKMRQVNKIVAAAVWAEQTALGLVPHDAQAAALDLDLDGELEYVLYNDRVFAVFENDGARLEYAFAYSPAVGPVQIVAPIYQVTIKRGTPDGNYEMGEIGELLTSSWQTDAAFVDDQDLDGKLDYPVYTASIQADHLVFSSPEGAVVKTFRLDGDTVYAHYAVHDGPSNNTNVGFATHLLQMYRQDWWRPWQVIQLGPWAGVQTAVGGLALATDTVSRGGVPDSFLQSPARQDGQERDDYDTYPPGHFFPFPYSTVCFWTKSDFALRLGADPLNLVFVPLVRR